MGSRCLAELLKQRTDFFFILLTGHLSVILVINQLNVQNLLL